MGQAQMPSRIKTIINVVMEDSSAVPQRYKDDKGVSATECPQQFKEKLGLDKMTHARTNRGRDYPESKTRGNTWTAVPLPCHF